MRIPRLAFWVLARVTPAARREDRLGDLLELYETRAARDGRAPARRWLWRQVLGAARVRLTPRLPESRRAHGDSLMQTIWQDLRYGARSLGRQPGFTATAVLMLALGIGANATIFSWVNAVLLNPLPGTARSGEIVQLVYTFRGQLLASFSHPDFREIRETAQTLQDVAARDDLAVGLVIDREGERGWAEMVSGNFFDVLGVSPHAGRVLADRDDEPGAPPVTVLGFDFWRARFGGDPSVVGRTIQVNAQPFTIVGVAPPGFQGGVSGLQFDLWLPLGTQPIVSSGGGRLDAKTSRWLQLLGRLAPGATPAQAGAEMQAIVSRFAESSPAYSNLGGWAVPLAESPEGGVSVLRIVLLILSAVGAIVLLIACANLAGLLLARASTRQREMAIRMSIGATRGRLVRQLLAEGVLLAAGGMAGALLALRWTVDLLMVFAPPSELPIHLAVGVDGAVVAYTAGVALLTVIVFALAPAWQAARTDVATRLRDAGPAGRAFGRHRLRRTLVAAQVALSVTLLVGAGLCLRSLQAATAMTPGFNPNGVAVGWIDLFAAGYQADTGREFYGRLLERVRALPGVEAATIARRIPLGFVGGSFTNVVVEGYQPDPEDPSIVGLQTVGTQYLQTLQVPLIDGRDIAASDVQGAPLVAVVSESMARKFWPEGRAVGGRFRFGRISDDADGEWITVVGVARDIKQRSLNERPSPHLYLATQQYYGPFAVVHARTSGDPRALAADLGRLVRELDAGVPFYNAGLLAEHTQAATFQQKMVGDLLTVFGALALLLAGIGAYGVLSFLVGQRRREIGIRLAIGASRRDVFGLVARSGAWLVGAGIAAGLVLSLGVGLGLESLLIGIGPLDPPTYGLALGVLALVGIVACTIPARRAAAVDPARTLRED